MNFDKSNDCYNLVKQFTEAELCLLDNIMQKHIPNYRPSDLTREVDEHFGVTKLTDCVHRKVKMECGINVY